MSLPCTHGCDPDDNTTAPREECLGDMGSRHTRRHDYTNRRLVEGYQWPSCKCSESAAMACGLFGPVKGSANIRHPWRGMALGQSRQQVIHLVKAYSCCTNVVPFGWTGGKTSHENLVVSLIEPVAGIPVEIRITCNARASLMPVLAVLTNGYIRQDTWQEELEFVDMRRRRQSRFLPLLKVKLHVKREWHRTIPDRGRTRAVQCV